ncbi:PQQ-dependent sugar dehydrogenase [Tessaracoccus sp. OS52]|uniref:PQQ-dependent sugar dehydrogenase n=1 Tax=Tessaracoccus sp. OS52 TaxID=2886691 RepID=UPI001D113019|nr:PQQ-dependent sugar dehydrogenase [Tessaracoccus sp. OS52]MCC2593455.1 PQQ-dependent sugar dehydrogenase [Tessaracoccus sp. OS52]
MRFIRQRRSAAVAATFAAVVALAGCGTDQPPPAPPEAPTTQPGTSPSSAPPASPESPASPSDSTSVQQTPVPSSSPPETSESVLMLPSGEPEVIAEGLENPWSLVFVDDQPLFTQRARATISTVVDGEVVEVARIEDARPEAEGGVLGIEVSPGSADTLFVYYTAARDNRVVSYPLARQGETFTLGEPTVIIEDIPKARAHNGGRIKFGPDGKLYVATGDASEKPRSQDALNLGGKILRVNPDGSIPGDNPNGSAVWSMGHRNVQGLAWADDGTMWATEFGQDTWDELNIIEPGVNYGWPEVEGSGGEPEYRDPVLTWTTDEASPSGLLYRDGNLYVAALRGERMWVMLESDPAGTVTDVLNGGPGRLRDIVAAPDGTIWVLTSNNGGDRILSYALAEA